MLVFSNRNMQQSWACNADVSRRTMVCAQPFAAACSSFQKPQAQP